MAFVTGSYFTQRDFPVIVLKTLMINKDGMYLILSIVQVLFGGFSTCKYIAHMFQNEKKTINISKNMVVFGIFHFSPMFTNNNL